MTLAWAPPSSAPHSALWQVLRWDQCQDMRGPARQSALVLV